MLTLTSKCIQIDFTIMVRGIDMSKPLFFVTPNTPIGRACIWTDKANRIRKAQIEALTPLAEKGNIMAYPLHDERWHLFYIKRALFSDTKEEGD